MKNIVLLFLSCLILQSCGQKKGCTNEWGSNFEHEALVDCCCEFDVQKIISEMTGTYQMKEACSGHEAKFDIEIKSNPSDNEGILISNYNNSGFEAAASWNSDEFKLENKWNQGECTVTLTGSIHKASSKLFFVYAAFPDNSCDEMQGKTCEARQI